MAGYMKSDREKLGMLGSGSAAKAGKAVAKQKKRKKKRLDDIMSGIRAGR